MRMRTLWLAALLAGCQAVALDDLDGDGITDAVDCAPSDASVAPGLAEDCENEVDDDCDGYADALDSECWPDVGALNSDDDGDGFSENIGDCDDGRITVHPGADETCGDGWDNDCNGVVDDCPDAGVAPVGMLGVDGTIINGTGETLDAVTLMVWGQWDAVPELPIQQVQMEPNDEMFFAGGDVGLTEGEGYYMIWVGYTEAGCYVLGGLDILRGFPLSNTTGVVIQYTIGLTPGLYREPCVLPPEVL